MLNVLICTLLSFILFGTLYCSVLFCSVLCFAVMCCSVSSCAVPSCSMLCCSVCVSPDRRKKKSKVLVVDDVFTPEGLEALRRYMAGNTMWHNLKPSGGATLHLCAALRYSILYSISALFMFSFLM